MFCDLNKSVTALSKCVQEPLELQRSFAQSAEENSASGAPSEASLKLMAMARTSTIQTLKRYVRVNKMNKK